MSRRMLDAMATLRGELRHEPHPRLLRALVDGQEAVRSTRGLLVWEPRRIIPSYAVPVDDVLAHLVPSTEAATVATDDGVQLLHPGIPFDVHSTFGAVLDLELGGRRLARAAFAPADPDLAGYVILDFYAFDAWLEEDAPVIAHPRDPFHRVDVLPTGRRVRIERGGVVLAESSRATFVAETGLPMRTYLPREDVLVELRPSDRMTRCAYKGEAGYLNPVVDGQELGDIVWFYERPLPAAHAIAGLVAFFDDEVDVFVDGELAAPERTALAATIADEITAGD